MTLQARRMFLGAELGSKYRWPTAIFFSLLWIIYVTVSIIVAYSQPEKKIVAYSQPEE